MGRTIKLSERYKKRNADLPEVEQMVIHQKGYNLVESQNTKNMKLYVNFNLNMAMNSGYGALFTPPESQAITTLKKRSAIAQHYKKSMKGRHSLNSSAVIGEAAIDQHHYSGLSPRATAYQT